jgi:hypothetical protein
MAKQLAWMQMIFIDSQDLARHTMLAMAKDTDAATWATFNSYRRFGVAYEKASFLLDYHKGNGDLCASIALDDAGFEAITGQKPKAEADYLQIDADYWTAARAELAATGAS